MAGFAFVKKHPGLSTLLLLEFLLFVVVSYQVEIEPKISLMEKIGLTLFGPVQELNDIVTGKLSRDLEKRKTITALQEENETLRESVKDVKQLEVRVNELALENERLRKLLDLRQVAEWDYVVAEVVGRSRRRSDYMLTINKGTNHGVIADRGVFSVNGAVGIVWEASGGYAKVMTLNNPGSVVAAIVQKSRYQESYLTGAGGDFGKLENFPNFEDIQPGDLILTSGLDRLFPKGVRIGEVISAEPTPSAYQDINVRLSTEFSRLEEVIVLVPKPEQEAALEME